MTIKHKKLVIIGGGTGLSTLLRGLKKQKFDITAIVTVADDGGSSGRLRDDYDIPPPGDIRNVIAALSDVEPLVEQMFQYRFSNSCDLDGHSLGNLMLTALTDITGDFNHAISEMCKVLNVNGTVIPAANKKISLNAELIDSTVIKGESKIPLANKRIKRVFIEPSDVKPLSEAVHAIEQADLLLIGPGSLYTSIIPNLLVKELGEAVVRSKAHKMYICNLMTQKGETIHYRATDHVRAIYDHIGTPFLHTILVNDVKLPQVVQESYKEECAEAVHIDVEQLEQMGLVVIKKDIATIQSGVVRHQASKVAQWLVDYLYNHLETVID